MASFLVVTASWFRSNAASSSVLTVPSPLRSATSLKSRWWSLFWSIAAASNGQPNVAVQEQSHTLAAAQPNPAATRTSSRPRIVPP
eukprot:scaffold23219_cov131-Isochrysis_galbana.AAC.8